LKFEFSSISHGARRAYTQHSILFWAARSQNEAALPAAITISILQSPISFSGEVELQTAFYVNSHRHGSESSRVKSSRFEFLMLSRSPLSTPVVPFISQRLLFTFSLDSVYLRICKLGNWAGLGGKLVVPYAHELPSKLKDANINGMMIIEMMMMVGTSLRWICRLARMQLKWAADQDQN